MAPVALRRNQIRRRGLQARGVGGRVGVLALLLGPLLESPAGLADERVHAVDRDAADVAVVGEVFGARVGHGGDGEVGEAVQEAVAGVGGGATRVVAHADREDRVLGCGHGHSRTREHLQDDQPEAGRHGVGEPCERRVLAVAAQQVGVLLVAGGQQLGLEAEGDEPRRVGGVGGRDGRGGRRGTRLRLAPVDVLGHGRYSSLCCRWGRGWGLWWWATC
ncbi:hypothetical protein SVIOM342S_06170 [Streptomyces violaceorubidus]